MTRMLRAVLALALASLLAGCGYNEIQRRDEAVKAAWAEVLSQYQRRADLIPNIVNTVKGEANFDIGSGQLQYTLVVPAGIAGIE